MPGEPKTRPTAPRELDSGDVFDLQTLCARAAQRWGARAALTFDATGEQLSFAEVDARSNQVANALLAMGCRPGERVGLMLRNRAEWPLTWLGIVKAGLVMVPLNVYYKTVDAGYLLKHADVSAVICEREFLPLVHSAAQQAGADALREAQRLKLEIEGAKRQAEQEANPHCLSAPH